MKKKEEITTLPEKTEDKPVVVEQSKKRGRPSKAVEAKAGTKPTRAKKTTSKAESVKQPIAVAEQTPVQPEVQSPVQKPVVAEKKKFTLNQEFNVLIGFLAIALIAVLCVNFQTGSDKLSGWELILKSNLYSGVFRGLLVFYVITLFIDCALAVKMDSENELFNTIEKVLYAVTLTANVIVGAILFRLIKKIGLGLIMFGILSLVSVIIKLARIYSK